MAKKHVAGKKLAPDLNVATNDAPMQPSSTPEKGTSQPSAPTTAPQPDHAQLHLEEETRPPESSPTSRTSAAPSTLPPAHLSHPTNTEAIPGTNQQHLTVTAPTPPTDTVSEEEENWFLPQSPPRADTLAVFLQQQHSAPFTPPHGAPQPVAPAPPPQVHMSVAERRLTADIAHLKVSLLNFHNLSIGDAPRAVADDNLQHLTSVHENLRAVLDTLDQLSSPTRHRTDHTRGTTPNPDGGDPQQAAGRLRLLDLVAHAAHKYLSRTLITPPPAANIRAWAALFNRLQESADNFINLATDEASIARLDTKAHGQVRRTIFESLAERLGLAFPAARPHIAAINGALHVHTDPFFSLAHAVVSELRIPPGSDERQYDDAVLLAAVNVIVTQITKTSGPRLTTALQAFSDAINTHPDKTLRTSLIANHNMARFITNVLLQALEHSPVHVNHYYNVATIFIPNSGPINTVQQAYLLGLECAKTTPDAAPPRNNHNTQAAPQQQPAAPAETPASTPNRGGTPHDPAELKSTSGVVMLGKITSYIKVNSGTAFARCLAPNGQVINIIAPKSLRDMKADTAASHPEVGTWITGTVSYSTDHVRGPRQTPYNMASWRTCAAPAGAAANAFAASSEQASSTQSPSTAATTPRTSSAAPLGTIRIHQKILDDWSVRGLQLDTGLHFTAATSNIADFTDTYVPADGTAAVFPDGRRLIITLAGSILIKTNDGPTVRIPDAIHIAALPDNTVLIGEPGMRLIAYGVGDRSGDITLHHDGRACASGVQINTLSSEQSAEYIKITRALAGSTPPPHTTVDFKTQQAPATVAHTNYTQQLVWIPHPKWVDHLWHNVHTGQPSPHPVGMWISQPPPPSSIKKQDFHKLGPSPAPAANPPAAAPATEDPPRKTPTPATAAQSRSPSSATEQDGAQPPL